MASYAHRDIGNLGYHIDEEWWSTSWINEGMCNIIFHFALSFLVIEIPLSIQALPLEEWDGGKDLFLHTW